jgi:hypothetical protein
MRVVLGLAGMLYFWRAGAVTGFLPLSRTAVLVLIAAYALANALLLTRRLRAGFGLTVPLDLAMLAVIVWEDPYPAAPVTVLLLSTTFDYGSLLPPAAFSGATVAALGILGCNVWARLVSDRFPLAPEGAWLSGVIGVLMLNFFTVARAAARARAERRRMAERIEDLNRREEASTRLQLRLARAIECMQLTGQPRAEYARIALECFVRELGASAGAVYELDLESRDAGLLPLAAYAVDLRRLRGRRVGLDEGLVGACAARGKAIELDQLPEGYFRLESGLGHGSPRRLLVVPLKAQTRLAGVMELALNGTLGEEDREVLERMLPMFATGLLVAAQTPGKPAR